MLSSARTIGRLILCFENRFCAEARAVGGVSAGDAGQEFSRGGEGLGGAVEVSYGNTIG